MLPSLPKGRPASTFGWHRGRASLEIYWNGRLHAASWPRAWHNSDITKDLTFFGNFPLLVSLGLHFQNKSLLFWCNNQKVIHIINTQSHESTASLTSFSQPNKFQVCPLRLLTCYLIFSFTVSKLWPRKKQFH